MVDRKFFELVIGTEVMGVTYVPKVCTYEEGFSYTLYGGEGKFINIYEYAYKAKQLLVSYGYAVETTAYCDRAEAILYDKDLNEIYREEGVSEIGALISLADMWYNDPIQNG